MTIAFYVFVDVSMLLRRNMNIVVLTKYFFITFCGFCVICKLQNLHPSKLKILLMFIGSILSAFVYIVIKTIAPITYILALVIPFILAAKIILKQPFKNIVPLGLVSIGVSYIFATIGVFLLASLTYIIKIFYKFDDSLWLDLILCILVGISQILLTFTTFKIKRFSKGIPELDKFIDSDLSMFISITIILFMSLVEIRNTDNIFIISIAFLVAFLGIVLFFAWKIRFNKIYINRQKKKELEELENTIHGLEQKSTEVTAENERMASIIHRDNKTISALINTVKNISLQTKDENTKNELCSFLAYLSSEHKERQLCLDCKNITTALPKTNIFSIDSILDFMKNKAIQNNINFKLILNNTIEKLTATIIKETDLVTLLADLIENAIIATKNSEDKQIEVQCILIDNVYQLSISDSGIPFEPIVLENFGTKKITTHKNEGGSGIGLITILDTIKKVNASLFLVQGKENYTKTISIFFDNKSILSIKNNLAVKE